jgi:predicted deacetylase
VGDMNKTIAEIIDELCITNMKIFFLVDKVQNDKHTREDAKRLQDLNGYRSQLKNAINAHYNQKQEVKV